jgi:hypothetical protein
VYSPRVYGAGHRSLCVGRVEAHSMIFQFARVVIHSFNNCCSQQRRGLWPTVQEFCVSSRVLYRIFATEGDFTSLVLEPFDKLPEPACPFRRFWIFWATMARRV